MENIDNVWIDTVILDKIYPLNMETINTIFSSHHDRDCCEDHWIDFDWAKSAVDTAFMLLPWFNQFSISWVPDMWILIRFMNTTHPDWVIKDTAVFFAGYNSNNWYYSDNLDLIVTLPSGFSETYDIREFQKPNWY